MRPRNSASTRPIEPWPRPCASRPRRSHSGTNGTSASGSGAWMLTALVTTAPASAARTCSAVSMPARSWASAVEAPRCGVTTTSSRANSGCSVNGSSGKTSRAAPPTLPGLEARIERVEVDQLAAGAVDDANAVLHRGDRLGVDPVDRLRGLRQVDRDQVGPRVELLAGPRPPRPPGRGTARARRTCRTPPPPSRTPGRGGRPAGRSGRTRSRPASSRTARCRRSGSAPTARRRASRAPAARCGEERAPSPGCARRPRPSSTRGRWRR